MNCEEITRKIVEISNIHNDFDIELKNAQPARALELKNILEQVAIPLLYVGHENLQMIERSEIARELGLLWIGTINENIAWGKAQGETEYRAVNVKEKKLSEMSFTNVTEFFGGRAFVATKSVDSEDKTTRKCFLIDQQFKVKQLENVF